MTPEKNKIIHINELSFEKVVNSGVVLVDFWAEWCYPCKIQASILNEIASQSEGKFIVAKVNVDENKSLSAKYKISSIPTLILFLNGKPTKQFVGIQPKQIILQTINNIINTINL